MPAGVRAPAKRARAGAESAENSAIRSEDYRERGTEGQVERVQKWIEGK